MGLYAIARGKKESHVRMVVRLINDVHEGWTLGGAVAGRTMTDAAVLFKQSLAGRHFRRRCRRDPTEHDLGFVGRRSCGRRSRRWRLGFRTACRAGNGE